MFGESGVSGVKDWILLGDEMVSPQTGVVMTDASRVSLAAYCLDALLLLFTRGMFVVCPKPLSLLI